MKLSYTTQEAVQTTNINRRKLYLLKDMGILKPTQVGKSYIWNAKELEDFMDWAKGLDLSNEATIKKALLMKPRGKA